jgi:hypothetical protein
MDGLYSAWSQEGGVVMSMDVLADIFLFGNCSCIALLHAIHGSIQNLHFHHPWRSYSAWSQEGGASMLKNKNILQKARKVIWICLFFPGFPTQLIASPENHNQANFHPFATRDQNLFNQVHGQALPTSAHLNKKTQSMWSSSLIITNALNIESNTDERIYIDYESYRFNLSYQYGLDDNWNLKLDIPMIYQNGGSFDSAIDSWHKFFSLPRANRPYVEDRQYDIQYDYQSQNLINLNEKSSTLGDLQIAIALSISKSSSSAMSLWMSLKLPTGDEDKLTGNGATDFSVWFALDKLLADKWFINLNAGAVVLGEDNYKNIPLSDHALYGHAALGLAVSENIDLKLQLQGHTSYYDQSRLKILSDAYFLTFGGSIKIDQCNQLDIAMSEDIKIDASPDASIIINWRHFSSHC